MIRKLLLVAFLFGALQTSAAERLLTPPAFAALRAYYSTPAIATDGTSCLAAWIARPYARTSSLMLQRLDAPSVQPTAAVIDPRLAFGRVDLIWSNGSYLLVYNADDELHAMRAGSDGVPIAGSDHVLAGDLRDAVVAANGTTTLLVAHTNFVENQVVTLTLDALDRVVKRTTIGNYAGARYDVAASGAGFVVALTDDPGLHALRFDAAGAQLGALIRVISPQLQRIPNPDSVAVASRGAETLIVWSAQLFQQPSELSAVVLSASGDLGPQIALPSSGQFTVGIDVISDGGGYTLLFAQPDVPGSIVRLYALALSSDATPASEPRRVTTDATSFESNGRLVRGSSGYGVVWIASGDALPPSAHDHVHGALAPALTGVTPRLLSRSATEQSGTSIASDGSGYLAAWLEQWSERDQIFAMPLDHDGAPSAPPLLLFERAAPSYPDPPRVTFSGGTYLVAWIGDSAVQGMRFDVAGRPLDAQPLPLSGSPPWNFEFDVTPTPGGFFVVWMRSGSIYGAALTGPLPGAPQKLTEHLPPLQPGGSAQFETEPHIAFNGTKFLLAYTSTYIYPCGDIPCQSAVTWELVRLDASGRRETEPHPLDIAPIDVATDGRDFAILGWNDLLRIDTQTLSVTARLSVPSERTPVLLWNGARYVAVAVDEEPDGGARVIAREITPEWTVAAARTANIAPRLGALDAAVNAAGDVLAAYSRSIADDPFQGAARAAVQFVRDVAPARRPAAKRP